MAVVVRLAGTFRVHTAGAQNIGAGSVGAGNIGAAATEHVIGSPKARRLLALLAARREQVVTPDGLVDALWGDQPPERPARNVATLVSRLRAQLGADVVVGDHRGDRLGAARVDVGDAPGSSTRRPAGTTRARPRWPAPRRSGRWTCSAPAPHWPGNRTPPGSARYVRR